MIAQKNGVHEDEWPNFEFYPDETKLTKQQVDKQRVNNYVKPFMFYWTFQQIISHIYEGDVPMMDLIYKKKALP